MNGNEIKEMLDKKKEGRLQTRITSQQQQQIHSLEQTNAIQTVSSMHVHMLMLHWPHIRYL